MPTRLAHLILCILLLALTAPVIQAQDAATPKRRFDPPRIIEILRTKDKGTDGQNENLLYFVNKGQEVNINRGDVLNVYREKRIHPSLPRTMRIFIGTLTITESQNGSSMGSFAAGAKIRRASMIP